MIKLETDRLILRPISTADFDDFYSYGSVPENMTYMIFGPYTEETAKKHLEMCEVWWKQEPQKVYEFAVVLKDSGKMIGNCGLYMDREQPETGLLGWCVHRDYWNKGYASEFASAIIKFGFEELGLHRIHAECNADNIGSAKVMEKAGMRREAHFINNRYDRVGDTKMWYSEFFYGILKDEYMVQVKGSAPEN